jgi:type II secretory pathway component PulM
MNEIPERSKQVSDSGSSPIGTPLAVRFESLSFRKRLKLLVLVILSVSALVETLIWGEAIWVWWKGEEGDSIDTV